MAAPKHGEIGRGRTDKLYNVNSKTVGGNGPTYALRRRKREDARRLIDAAVGAALKHGGRGVAARLGDRRRWPRDDRSARGDARRSSPSGARGANIALMVEVLAAGLAGANWSLDAPPHISGNRSPGAGLLVIALAPALLAPDFPRRLQLQLERFASFGVHTQGRRSAAAEIELPDALAAEIERAGAT